MKILKCPHCNKSYKSNQAKRHHFDNCIYHTDLEKRENAIKKKKEMNLKIPKIECPHCGKNGISANIRRWHIDNCKNIPKK